MEIVLEILKGLGVGLLGGILFTLIKVWKNFPLLQFSYKKFFADNRNFWLVSGLLNLVVVVAIKILPELAQNIQALGLVVEPGQGDMGHFWIGVGIAKGANNERLVGKRVEASKTKTKPNEGDIPDIDL